MQAGLFSGLKNAVKGDVPDVSDAADAVKANVPKPAESAVSAVADAVPNPSEAKARLFGN
jgi:hypothetical protein